MQSLDGKGGHSYILCVVRRTPDSSLQNMFMACCLAPCGKDNVLDYLLCCEPTHVRTALEVLAVLAQESKRRLVERVLQAERQEDCIGVLTQILCSTDHWWVASDTRLRKIHIFRYD